MPRPPELTPRQAARFEASLQALRSIFGALSARPWPELKFEGGEAAGPALDQG